MKSGYLSLTFIVLSLSFFSSCNKDASFADLPEFNEKIVINAFLSPDQAENKIFVSWTRPRFGELKEMETARNPSLLLYENSKEVHLDTIRENWGHNAGWFFYIRNFNFKEGLAYHLKVINDLGQEAEATCKIPLKRDFKISVDTVFSKTTDDFGDTSTTLIVKPSIIDFPGETNYYRILYLFDLYIHGDQFPLDLHLDEGDKMHNDIGSEGGKIFLRPVKIPSGFLDWGFYGKPDSCLLTIYLLNTDKPYNDFHVSLNNYSAGDTPFTEASLSYSNVLGGLGIFASYVVDSVVYRLK